VLTSQPVLGLSSQSPKPWKHETSQLPPLQNGEPFCAAGQSLLHAPQLLMSVCVFVQVPLQFCRPPVQFRTQTPLWQTSPASQDVVQFPQCCGSDWRAKHWLPQPEKPELHRNEHEPPEHTGLAFAGAWHTVVQVPQCAGSLFLSVSQPGAAVQFSQPVWQDRPQVPLLQVGVEWGPPGQTLPQAPQLLGSAFLLTHWLPQSSAGGVQVCWHEPLLQTNPVPQPWPQPPQLAGSVCVFTHCPLQYVCAPAHVYLQALF
jgi:hypothetical protein